MEGMSAWKPGASLQLSQLSAHAHSWTKKWVGRYLRIRLVGDVRSLNAVLSEDGSELDRVFDRSEEEVQQTELQIYQLVITNPSLDF